MKLCFYSPLTSCRRLWQLEQRCSSRAVFLRAHSTDSNLTFLAFPLQTFLFVLNGNSARSSSKRSSRMEGVAHNSFKNNKLLPSFLLLITHFIKQIFHTLPFGLGMQNEKKNLLTCHGRLCLSSLFHKVSEKCYFLLSNFQRMYLAKITLWSEAKK